MNKLLIMSAVLGSIAAANADSYQLQIRHSEARDVLNEMLQDSQFNSADPEDDSKLVRLLDSYRLATVPNNLGNLTLSQAPYVGFVVQKELIEGSDKDKLDANGKPKPCVATGDCGWKDEYQSQYKVQWDQLVNKDSYEDWFDLVMSAASSGQLPSQLSQINELGSCLIKKVEQASEQTGCKLDNSENSPHSRPSVFRLAWMKYTCFASWVTPPCEARQEIFNYAKPLLIDAKKPITTPDGKHYVNLMDEFFPQIFPSQFRTSILGGINHIQGTISNFVSTKFGTKPDGVQDYWDAPIVDVENTQNSSTGSFRIRVGLVDGYACGL